MKLNETTIIRISRGMYTKLEEMCREDGSDIIPPQMLERILYDHIVCSNKHRKMYYLKNQRAKEKDFIVTYHTTRHGAISTAQSLWDNMSNKEREEITLELYEGDLREEPTLFMTYRR